MCNLYANVTAQEEMRRLFAVPPARDRLGNAAPQPAIFPRHDAPVVRLTPEGAREMLAMQWGFALPQVSKRTGRPILPKAVTNARDDRLAASPFWRDSFETRRCLAPASAFCEPKGRAPAVYHWFGLTAETREARAPFAMAAIWRRWRGEMRGEAIDLEQYAIITTRPNPLVARVHPARMPVILDPDAHETWLTGSAEAAQRLLRPYPEARMRELRRGEGAREDRPGAP
ncbi:SOS response-associated peptidase [Roseovarius ramblicola]|uniref:Abasic site processing protein n=1 Tax=Roseovarius ramblicola TaxID=2022336 RepID=A0ABV5HZY6_9RHOB